MKGKLLFATCTLLLLTSCVSGVSSTSEKNSSISNQSEIISNATTNSINTNTSENSTTSEHLTSSINKESSTSSFNSQIDHSLTYQEKIDAYIDGAAINDQEFINKIKSIDGHDEGITSNAIYASPNGNGEGTYESPYALQDAFDSLKAGQTLYLRGGTYDTKKMDGYFINCKGTKDAYIKICAYPGEKVLITNSYKGKEAYGFQVDGGACYFILEGIEIANIKSQSSYGIAFWGNNQNHIIIRNMDIHHIETTSSNPETDTNSSANAIILFGEQKNPISNVALINNHCHDNKTGWAETISVTANCEYIYVLENKVENNTNIGIDFYGNAGYCSTPSLDQPRYCVAANNIIANSFCAYADCAGLYVDGSRDILLQYNVIKNCQYGIEIGSEEGHRQPNYPVKNIIVRNNVCENNSVTAFRIGGYEEKNTGIVKDTKIINNTFINKATSGDNAEIIIAKVDNIEFKNNLLYKNNNGDIVSTDFNETYSKNIKFTNNLFYQVNKKASEVTTYIFKNSKTGIEAFNNVFNGTTLYHEFKVNEDYTLPLNSYAVDLGEQDLDIGNYDYYLNKRIKGKTIDIGACEA